MATILDEKTLATVHGGSRPPADKPLGQQKRPLTRYEVQKRQDENLCARHWLAVGMGIGQDQQAYRDGCKRMEQRQRSPLDFHGPLSP